MEALAAEERERRERRMRRFGGLVDAARPVGWHGGELPAAPSPRKRARLANSNDPREPPPGPDEEGRPKRARQLPAWAFEPGGASLPPRRRAALESSPSPAAAGVAGDAGGRTIDLTGESPQLAPAARRQGTLTRANARVQGRAGGAAGADGRMPARRSVVVIDDDSPGEASEAESDDEGGRRSPYSTSRGQRRREPAGAGGAAGASRSGGARAKPHEAHPAPQRRRDSGAVVLIEDPLPAPRGRRDKGKAPADERPADAPAAVARGDKLQITSTVSRPFTCPICYDDVEKGG